MKKLLGFLLTGVLLFALPFAANADESLPEEEPETKSSAKIVIVASEDDLPDGYVVDPDFIYEFELSADSDWMSNLTEWLEENASDEYIYFFVEQDIPEGYTPDYTLDGTDFSDGTIIVIKNVKKGEPPVYELPQTGGAGEPIYIAAGSAIMLTVAAYSVILTRKRKLSEI